MIDEKIENFKEGTEVYKIIDIIQEIIIEIIITYISGPDENDENITEEGNKCIKKFLTEFFQNSMNSYLKCLDKIINEKVEVYIQEINELQLKIIEKHNGYYKNVKEKYEIITILKKELLDSVKSKAELFCMKNAGKFIAKSVKDHFEEFIKFKYEKIFSKEEKIQIALQKEIEKNLDRLNNCAPTPK